MPNLTFEFSYIHRPSIPAIARAPLTNEEASFTALIDTGADMTILDVRIASELGLDLDGANSVVLNGVGGGSVRGYRLPVDLLLLEELDLLVSLEVAFVPDFADTYGNLIGRDVLEYLDFALTHSTRVGYLGRTETLV